MYCVEIALVCYFLWLIHNNVFHAVLYFCVGIHLQLWCASCSGTPAFALSTEMYMLCSTDNSSEYYQAHTHTILASCNKRDC